MKLQYTTKDGRITATLEGSTQKELFKELARFQEVFEEIASGDVDGKYVTSDDIQYKVRSAEYVDEKGKTKSADYYEKVVRSGKLAGYKKAFGILDDSTDGLFPKWKAPEENIQGYNGWSKYVKDKS